MDVFEAIFMYGLWETRFKKYHEEQRDSLIREAETLECQGHNAGAIRRMAGLHDLWIAQRNSIVTKKLFSPEI